MSRLRWLGCVVGALALTAPTAAALDSSKPAPCAGVQITDADGDGHHVQEDVLSAFFKDVQGEVTANVVLKNAQQQIAHDEKNEGVFRVLYAVGGQTYWVGLTLTRTGVGVNDNAATYEYGKLTGSSFASGTFTKLGTTQGKLFAGSGGAIQIVVPAAVGGSAGQVLRQPFVVTGEADLPNSAPAAIHWTDRAPGGSDPLSSLETSYGSDYPVVDCAAPGGGPAGTQVSATSLTSVDPIDYGQSVRLRGRVAPARAGVDIDLLAARKGETHRRVAGATTAADGSFAIEQTPRETTDYRATAAGIGSQSQRVQVRSVVRLSVKRRARGLAFKGSVVPDRKGTVVIEQRSGGQYIAVGSAKLRRGRFATGIPGLSAGRYRATFTDSGRRRARGVSAVRRVSLSRVARARVAHTTLRSTSPIGGSRVSKQLRFVTATFADAVKRGTVSVVRISDGSSIVRCAAVDSADHRIVRARLKRHLRAGRYRATWHIVAADRHSQSGSFRFSLR